MGKHLSSRNPRLLFTIFLLLLLAQHQNAATETLAPNEVIALNTIVSKLKPMSSSQSDSSTLSKYRIKQTLPNFESGSCSNQGSTYGISCNCSKGNFCHVTEIDFSNRQLSGIVPGELANLTLLKRLDLSNNFLKGSIPPVLSTLKSLMYLDLSQNSLNGAITAELGAFPSLSYLDLGENFLTGSISAKLGTLPSLSYIDLWGNDLSGPIPDELGNISTLQILDLTENRLSGFLPEALGKLRNLAYLFLPGNEFTGGFPKSFARLQNLIFLDVTGNNFFGPIPQVIENLTQLQYLRLIGNNFKGPLPISGLSNLINLMISDLNETSEGGLLFPDISRMKSLQYLILRNCSITDKIPDYIGHISSLTYIDLSFNKLTGEVPKSIKHLGLDTIYLTRNNLIGPIHILNTSSAKIHADFSHNNFTNVSFKYSNNSLQNMNLYACCSSTTPNLSFLWESKDFYCPYEPNNTQLYINCGGEGKMINGSFYDADLQKYGASSVYVSPNITWAYSSTGDFIGSTGPVEYVQNRTCGISMVDAPLYTTARLSPLSLNYYGLCLINGNYIVKLHFAEIIFTEYENDYSNKWKRVFDVFIQGKNVLKDFNIKEEAGGSNKAVVKNFTTDVKNHSLEIHLYWAGQGSIYIQPKLYGPLISAISVIPVPKGSAIKLSAISIAGIVGSAVLFIVLVLVFLWKMGWLGGKELRDEELKALELFPGGWFNFRQIKAATHNFDPANKIGEGGFGSVYKGVLPNGMAIAVKQLSSKSKQGIREFVNEVGTISALQHPNLVRLLGCCTEDNQLLLVYEYMENNSLASALFGPGDIKSRLNWPTRVKICLGIAKGLAFLHEESKLKIVHRDIKPTNVLLDNDLNAKISDFGMAKLYEGENTHIITKIAGTTGYMAPEYAMRGYLTNKADVYSFGVVTLEILSGKNSSDYRPSEETVFLLDLAYVLQQKGNLLALIDPVLGMNYSVKEATRVLDLAMLCTNTSPTLRPIMSEVVSILEGKTKMKALPHHAPYSTDDFVMAKAMADLSLSTNSGSGSTEGTSNAFSSSVKNNEGKEQHDESMQITPDDISDETADLQN